MIGRYLDEPYIRPATLQDASMIASVHVEAWQESYKDIIDADYIASMSLEDRRNNWENILQNPSSDAIYLVAVHQDKVVGFCAAGPCRDQGDFHGEIYAIYLLDEIKGKGVGAKLLQETRSFLEEKSFLPFLVWVLKDNVPARNFYEKNGGQLLDEKVREFGDKSYKEVSYVFR